MWFAIKPWPSENVESRDEDRIRAVKNCKKLRIFVITWSPSVQRQVVSPSRKVKVPGQKRRWPSKGISCCSPSLTLFTLFSPGFASWPFLPVATCSSSLSIWVIAKKCGVDSSVLHDLRRETKIDTCVSFHKHNTILLVVSLACVSVHLLVCLFTCLCVSSLATSSLSRQRCCCGSSRRLLQIS